MSECTERWGHKVIKVRGRDFARGCMYADASVARRQGADNRIQGGRA